MTLDSIHRGMYGDPPNGVEGLNTRVAKIETRLEEEAHLRAIEKQEIALALAKDKASRAFKAGWIGGATAVVVMGAKAAWTGFCAWLDHGKH